MCGGGGPLGGEAARAVERCKPHTELLCVALACLLGGLLESLCGSAIIDWQYLSLHRKNLRP